MIEHAELRRADVLLDDPQFFWDVLCSEQLRGVFDEIETLELWNKQWAEHCKQQEEKIRQLKAKLAWPQRALLRLLVSFVSFQKVGAA